MEALDLGDGELVQLVHFLLSTLQHRQHRSNLKLGLGFKLPREASLVIPGCSELLLPSFQQSDLRLLLEACIAQGLGLVHSLLQRCLQLLNATLQQSHGWHVCVNRRARQCGTSSAHGWMAHLQVVTSRLGGLDLLQHTVDVGIVTLKHLHTLIEQPSEQWQHATKLV